MELASIIGASSSKRRLSFNDRPGLTDCMDDDLDPNDGPGSARGLQRTISYPSEDDVDNRADAFIANFYKQLKIERQISLELSGASNIRLSCKMQSITKKKTSRGLIYKWNL
ncbi:hypothetical protein BUALT_Bualt12G0060900 [Buddleja alternifolia]|uniref:Uncharacterized protein n=1 Tax=Buddleja alternifolia TaxID=168488 RepID=A0AAV6WVB3_9LAMI|nr:hypothetical protein BUALT_Bualt12G0060900 [Buddleja alternifolia]